MRPASDITGYLEHPVKGASIAFAVLFFASGVLHAWQSHKYNSWFYTWLLPCACLIFTASFISREYTAYHPNDAKSPPFQGLFYSGVLIITWPLYCFLPRLLSTHPSLSLIRLKYVYPVLGLFFTAIISIGSQGSATFFSPDATESTTSSGLALLKASLVIQLFLNIAFISIITVFYCQPFSKGNPQQSSERRIKLLIISLYISVILILICNLFSTVQLFLRSDSPAWTVEAYFWVFNATPMLVYTIFLNIMHPAKYFETQSCRSACDAPGSAED